MEQQQIKPTLFTVYNTANEIVHTPEAALKEGLGMVKTIKDTLKQLELGSKLRQEVWDRELTKCVIFPSLVNRSHTRFQFGRSGYSEDTDSCMRGYVLLDKIAFLCLIKYNKLATGAGKSSIMNAILDGMQAFHTFSPGTHNR